MIHQPKKSQRGVALLIAIFSLLLISGAAIAMIMMAGTESQLNANYRRSTISFYGATAGLEEGRERLVPCSQNTLWPVAECNAPGTGGHTLFNNNPPTVVGQVMYIRNPSATDPAFNPQSDPVTSPYYDSTYVNEFGVAPTPNANQITNTAAMTQAGGLPPLSYKWVRITLKSEAMGGIDLDGNGVLDTTLPVRVDGQGRQCLPTQPNCAPNPNVPVSTRPVFRLTAFAMEPTGARRLVQAEMAQTPIINPNGAIASQAGVSINGNFNAFGAWPPIVSGTCGSGKTKKTGPTCGTFSKGAVALDCNNPYDPATDTCNGVPRSHNDYCNVGAGVNSVSSAGGINSGNYDEVPDNTAGCTTTGSGCIFTASPQQATAPNIPNWPYDMNQIIQMYKPPVTEPAQNFGVTCGSYDLNGNRQCGGSGVQMGTLPSPWPPPPNTPVTNNNPKLVFAEVGPGGELKLSGASSGSGILVVDGDLELTGGFQWYGLIIVRGVVKFTGGGSTGTNVMGGVLAGQSVTNANTTTGGSVSVTYNSCAFRNNSQSFPLRYLSFREVSQ